MRGRLKFAVKIVRTIELVIKRRRNTRYKNPQLVAQHCFVASFGSMFRVFHLAWSTCRATKTLVAGWRNAAGWSVDLLCVDAWQVVSLMKNEQQSQNLLLKADPRSTFRNNFLQPATNAFAARQVDHARWKTRNIDPKLATKQCCAYIHSFFIRRLFFPAQAEDSYFSADFRLKILLWILLDYRNKKLTMSTKQSNYLFYHDFDDVEVIFEPDCGQQRLIWHT